MGKLAKMTILVLVWALSAPGFAAEYKIDDGRSIFAVLTHKAGIGSGLAHDHLIVATKPVVTLAFDPAAPETMKFSFTVAVESLEVDAPAARAAWKGRFKELGIHSGELPPVSDSDRGKVRAAMLDEGQLDGAKFPEIRAEVLTLAKDAGKKEDAWTMRVRLTIHGKSVERELSATCSVADGILTAEIVSELTFKEFGIEPYSTMLGAIRNDNRFHLFVRVVARPANP